VMTRPGELFHRRGKAETAPGAVKVVVIRFRYRPNSEPRVARACREEIRLYKQALRTSSGNHSKGAIQSSGKKRYGERKSMPGQVSKA